MKMPDLADRAAIVTGAAMGIGRASALALAREGASVTIADVDEAAGERTRADIEAAGGRAIFVRTDVTSFADAKAATEATMKAFGRIDVLVNNAARAICGVVDEIEEEDWNRVISNNLTSVWRFM
jgi:NAD(P)-dependent dehydrogenase (short-subunit alcohol dehydrogenase family)